jgi:hypothetical protein
MPSLMNTSEWSAMRKFLNIIFCSIAVCAFLPGCGESDVPEPVPVEETNKPESSDDLKSRLQEIAESGEAGSRAAGLRPAIEELESGAVKEELLKNLSKLESSNNPEQVKSIAKEMVSKL